MSNFRRRLSVKHPKLDYLKFTALAPSTITRTGSYASSLEYSKDEINWKVFDSTVTIELAEGEAVSFRGKNSTLASSLNSYTQFVMTGSIAASGNIMSLLYKTNFPQIKKISTHYCFYILFKDCTVLQTAPSLPATILAKGCYYSMFEGCSSLVETPNLPATILDVSCYQRMFYGCSGLLKASKLPATVLKENCYQYMFCNCTSLLNAPNLPATEGASYCYNSMFRYCTSLVTPPKLKLQSVAKDCCVGMFYGCNKLKEAPVLLSEMLASSCYDSMFRFCSNLTYVKMLAINGTESNWGAQWLLNTPNSTSCIFVKHIDAEWTNTGVDNGVPDQWTIIYYNPDTDKYYLSDKTTECDDHGNII